MPVLTERVELPPAVTEAGLKLAVAPAGTPLTEKETVSAVPLVTAVATVYEVEPPCWTVWLAGLGAMEKSFAAATPQPGSLNEPMRVFQLKLPLAGMYSLVYQKVQPSTGSIVIAL